MVDERPDEARAHDALDHLQVAALELIAAARALLDVAEEALREPAALHDLVVTTARAASEVAATLARAAVPEPAATRRSGAGRHGEAQAARQQEPAAARQQEPAAARQQEPAAARRQHIPISRG